MFDSYVIGRY